MGSYNSEKNILKNGKPVIGIIAGSLNSFYQEGIVRGAVDAAEQFDFNVITFAAGPIKNPDPNTSARDFLFNIIDIDLFDGFIVPFSSHTRHLSTKEERDLINRFSVKPLVNIGSHVTDCTNIITDYKPGLDELIGHYINDHGYKKIALVRGPIHHASSETRENIYRESIRKYGLEVDDDLIVTADLRKTAAEFAVKELFDIREVECDAIITVNDNIAASMMDELHKRGLDIPKNIAIAGSMNSPLCNHSSPSLTSVIEPTYELGKAAMLTLEKKMKGEEVPEVSYIPTALIKRDSCGCTKQFKKHTLLEKNITTTDDIIFEEIYNRSLDILYNSSCADCYSDFEWVFEQFKETFIQREFDKLMNTLDNFMYEAVRTHSFTSWLSVMSEFMRGLIKLADKYREDDEVYNFLKSFILIKDEYEKMAAAYQSYETDSYIIYFKDIVNSLNSSFSMRTVKSFAANILDISDIYISLYNQHSNNDEIITSTSLMITRDGVFQDLNNSEYTYDVKALIPQHLKPYKDRYNLLVMALTYSKKQLGTLVMNLSKKRGSAFENIQVIISNALKNESQIEELKEAEKIQLQYKNHLEELVKERTIELETSIKNLKDTQKKLVEAEKMASMGELVAGVAHEINTPLGICLTSSSHMSEESKKIQELYIEKSVTKSRLEDYLKTMTESSTLNLSNIERASRIITSFKQMAVDQTSEIVREFDLSEYINSILSNLFPDTSKDNYIINYSYTDKIMVKSYPGVFTQILTFLITNAVKHGFIYDEMGVIDIILHRENENITLIFQNNGKAIPQEHLEKIFNPFFTTSRSEGNQGLGLNITYNLVAQKLQGTIECESMLNGERGTRFIIRFRS